MCLSGVLYETLMLCTCTPVTGRQRDDDREDEGAGESYRGKERQSQSQKSGGGNDYVCSGQRRRQRGNRLRSSPRGSALASVILGPFTQSPLLQGFPSPHGHHYKIEQLHLIRLQRVARLPHPKTSEKRRLQVTQQLGRTSKRCKITAPLVEPPQNCCEARESFDPEK